MHREERWRKKLPIFAFPFSIPCVRERKRDVQRDLFMKRAAFNPQILVLYIASTPYPAGHFNFGMGCYPPVKGNYASRAPASQSLWGRGASAFCNYSSSHSPSSRQNASGRVRLGLLFSNPFCVFLVLQERKSSSRTTLLNPSRLADVSSA